MLEPLAGSGPVRGCPARFAASIHADDKFGVNAPVDRIPT